MKKFAAVAMTAMMCVFLAAGCGNSDDKEEATEAAEPVTEISITADTVDMPTEPPVEAEIEEYDFAVQEETVSENAEPEVEEPEVEVDEFGVAAIDEIKLYAKETVKMRSEPNTDSDVKGMLKAGEEVSANGKSEEWHRIVRSNGDTVYVKSEFLTETKPEKKEEAKADENSETKKTENAAAATDTSAADAAAAAAAAAQAQDAANKEAASKAAEEAANQAAAAQAAAAQAAAATVAVGKYKDYDFTEAQIANDWNSHGLSKTINKTWNQLGEGEKADAANHYSHYGAAGW